LLVTLANREKARAVSVHDRCKAKFDCFSAPNMIRIAIAAAPANEKVN
jgi:hypothetical protein